MAEQDVQTWLAGLQQQAWTSSAWTAAAVYKASFSLAAVRLRALDSKTTAHPQHASWPSADAAGASNAVGQTFGPFAARDIPFFQMVEPGRARSGPTQRKIPLFNDGGIGGVVLAPDANCSCSARGPENLHMRFATVLRLVLVLVHVYASDASHVRQRGRRVLYNYVSILRITCGEAGGRVEAENVLCVMLRHAATKHVSCTCMTHCMSVHASCACMNHA